MESNISTDSSLQNEALESLIRSYQESMDHVYKAKEYEKGFIIEWQKEEDRKKILKEQEELTNAILGIKQTLKNQIQSKHPRSLEFKEILGILENPIHSTNESLPLYQVLGMSNENLLALLEFGKELLDQHSNEKAIELFTIVTFLDYKNFEFF
ncbi:MAG: hypothetical protein K2X39_00045, partial [Silvanigrellaceae bacterium]|nr:hypothetical protein [Silvanigrellaceae bacterium]